LVAHVSFCQTDQSATVPRRPWRRSLNAIPLGPALPSRADGTLLSEKLTVLPPLKTVYYMARGARRCIPDARQGTGAVWTSATFPIARRSRPPADS
jgi:hypothetical protein